MEIGLTVVAARSGARADVVVRGAASTPLAEMLPRLGELVGAPGEPVWCGARRLLPDDRIGNGRLVEGAVLTVGELEPVPPCPVALLRLHVVSGPSAGLVRPLAPGTHHVGRDVACDVRLDDPDVSRRHARLDVAPGGVTVTDLGSTNGTALDAVTVETGKAVPVRPGALLRLGESVLTIVVPDEPAARLDRQGPRALYNRPPRVRVPNAVTRIELPAPPPVRTPGRLPVLATVAPLLVGIGLAAIVRDWRYLAFMVLSPVMVVGQAVSERLGIRRDAHRAAAEHVAALAGARSRLAAAVRTDELRRRRAMPDAARLLEVVGLPLPALWERRPDEDDFLLVRVGVSNRPAHVDVTPADQRPLARDVPVGVALPRVGVLGVAGPRAVTTGVARWIVGQVAALHSPRDVGVVVLSPSAANASDWEWVRWLPHVRADGSGSETARVATGAEQVRARVAELRSLVRTRTDAARAPRVCLVVVLDGARRLRGEVGVAELLADGPKAGLSFLCIDDDDGALPAECRAVAVVSGEVDTRLDLRVAGEQPIDGIVADQVSMVWAERLARALAPLRDATPTAGVAGLPESVRWATLSGLSLTGAPTDADLVAGLWRCGPSTTALLGATAMGPFAVDLRRDGPHVLIGGTTGSGKSELLQTLVASLAAANSPQHLSFVLIDFKGGAAFGECARLPHVTGLVTDLDPPLTERALVSLSAELRRREALLAAAGVGDLADYPATLAPLPRLVIVVDEFATLAEELPDFVGGLVAVAQRGRSLGVHLVLATQRPEGVVSADVRANANLRICLGVTRENESRDVIDVPDAAWITRSTPGRAYARTGHQELTAFQTARVTALRSSSDVARPTVEVVPFTALGSSRASADDVAMEAATDLAILVEATRTAAAREGGEVPAAPWLPPLPPCVRFDEVAQTPGAYAVVDLPAEQRRGLLSFAFDDPRHLLVVGTARSGRTTALRTLATAATTHRPADALHLYAVDAGSGLGGLSGFPHCGGVVDVDETERVGRLLSMLTKEVARRRREVLGAHVRLLLLVDGWERFQATYGDVDGGRLVDQLLSLLADGAAVGLAVVLTADRSALLGRLPAAIADKLVLRLADPGDFALIGLPTRSVPAAMPPGRGVWSHGLLSVQVAHVGNLADRQDDALATLAADACRRSAHVPANALPRRVDPMPDKVALAELGTCGSHGVVLGVGGDVLDPLTVDFADTDGVFLVAGPPRSGRSSALLTIAAQTQRPVVAVAPRSSPVRRLAAVVTDRADATGLDELLARCSEPPLVLVDDAELVTDSALAATLERLVRAARDGDACVVVAGTTDDLVAAFRGPVAEARRARAGVLLAPRGPLDGELLGVRLPRLDGGSAPAGRGLLVRRGEIVPIHIALTHEPADAR